MRGAATGGRTCARAIRSETTPATVSDMPHHGQVAGAPQRYSVRQRERTVAGVQWGVNAW